MVDATTTISSSPAVIGCECNHMTSFAILMDASPSQGAGLSEQEQLDLSIFVYFCVAISIGCLTIVIVVYLLFSELRTQSKTVLMHLCVSYDIALVLFMVSGMAGLEGESCKVVGAALHFALLSTFLWMLVEAYMLHQTFTNVFGHRRQDKSKALRWYMGTAYGLPLIEVLVAYFAWPAAYERDDGVCFLAKKNNAMWLFVGPVLVVIVLNVYALVKISRVIYDMPVVSPRDSTTAEIIGKAPTTLPGVPNAPVPSVSKKSKRPSSGAPSKRKRRRLEGSGMTDIGPIELGHGASVSAVAFDRSVLPDGATVVNKTNALQPAY